MQGSAGQSEPEAGIETFAVIHAYNTVRRLIQHFLGRGKPGIMRVRRFRSEAVVVKSVVVPEIGFISGAGHGDGRDFIAREACVE